VRILFANNICGYFGGVEQVIVDTARGFRERAHVPYLAYRVKERNVGEFAAPFEACYQCSEFAPPEENSEGQPFHSILETVRPDAIYFHKVTRLPPSGDFLGQIRSVRMVHDHDLYCPTTYKYFRRGRRICHHRAGWRCWIDLAFLAKSKESRTGVALVSIPAKIREMHRNRDLDAILANSSFTRDALIMNGFPRDRTHIVHPVLALADPPFTPVLDDPKILFIGQLVRGKGVDLLLRALTRVKSSFSLTVIGTGNSRDILRALSEELGLQSRVRFLDWVDHDEVGRFYTEAKVVAAPSRWPEPFMLIGQEAMRYGRPVVAFNVGGIGNWLEHELTGLLVPEQNLAAYAAALDRVLTNTAYANRLGENAYRRVRERFSFKKYLDQLEAHLSGAALPA
jgi:glycosyltransferase involved in cell wall biosynthesis